MSEQRHDDPELEELDQVEETAPDVEEVAPEPVLVRIRYAGNTYEVPEHLADVWAKREEEFQRKLTEQGRELGQLRQQTRQEPAKVTPPAKDDDEDLAFFQSPSEVIRRREEALREQLREEFRQEQRLIEQRKEYWNAFYQSNPSLVGREKLVNAVVAQEYEAIKDLSPAESRARIAEVIGEMLGSSTRETKPLPKKQAEAERPGNPAPAPRKPAPTERLSLSDELRRRAELRRQAQFNTKE